MSADGHDSQLCSGNRECTCPCELCRSLVRVAREQERKDGTDS